MKYIFFLVVLLTNVCFSDEYNIMINADFTYNKQASVSIERGINYILKYGQYTSSKHRFNIIKCDHRGISGRSNICVKKFINDPKALIMFTGIHSAPIIANNKSLNKEFSINLNHVLTLDPWAAGASITREKGENWIYRLSADDKYAGAFIAEDLIKEGDRKIALFLQNDSWGQHNLSEIKKVLDKNKIDPINISMIDRDITEGMANVLVDKVLRSGATAIILVTNAPQGKYIFKSINALGAQKKIKVRSHWGISGTDFLHKSYDLFSEIDFKLLQTKFNFCSDKLDHYEKTMLNRIISDYSDIRNEHDIMAPNGLIHAHDLMLIVTKYMQDYSLSGDAKSVSKRLKELFETKPVNVKGLVKFYAKPFSSISESEDGHEALGKNDLIMVSINENGHWESK